MSKLKGKELTAKRLACNTEIIRRLLVYIEANPDIRFNQALTNLNIIEQVPDKFFDEVGIEPYDMSFGSYYLEPEEVLKRMK